MTYHNNDSIVLEITQRMKIPFKDFGTLTSQVNTEHKERYES